MGNINKFGNIEMSNSNTPYLTNHDDFGVGKSDNDFTNVAESYNSNRIPKQEPSLKNYNLNNPSIEINQQNLYDDKNIPQNNHHDPHSYLYQDNYEDYDIRNNKRSDYINYETASEKSKVSNKSKNTTNSFNNQNYNYAPDNYGQIDNYGSINDIKDINLTQSSAPKNFGSLNDFIKGFDTNDKKSSMITTENNDHYDMQGNQFENKYNSQKPKKLQPQNINTFINTNQIPNNNNRQQLNNNNNYPPRDNSNIMSPNKNQLNDTHFNNGSGFNGPHSNYITEYKNKTNASNMTKVTNQNKENMTSNSNYFNTNPNYQINGSPRSQRHSHIDNNHANNQNNPLELHKNDPSIQRFNGVYYNNNYSNSKKPKQFKNDHAQSEIDYSPHRKPRNPNFIHNTVYTNVHPKKFKNPQDKYNGEHTEDFNLFNVKDRQLAMQTSKSILSNRSNPGEFTNMYDTNLEKYRNYVSSQKDLSQIKRLESEINEAEKDLFMDEIDKISQSDQSNSYYNMNMKNKSKKDYKPYTLEDYKQNHLVQNKNTLPKSLGTNVGNNDWVDKKTRAIKAQEFAKQVNDINKENLHSTPLLAITSDPSLNNRSSPNRSIANKSQTQLATQISMGDRSVDSSGNKVLPYKKRFNYQQEVGNKFKKKNDNLADDLRMLNDLENIYRVDYDDFNY